MPSFFITLFQRVRLPKKLFSSTHHTTVCFAMDATEHQTMDNEPALLLDLLVKAADSGKGLIFVDNGIDTAPTRISYSELLQLAKVSGKCHLKVGQPRLITT
jgi:hypothetical protein